MESWKLQLIPDQELKDRLAKLKRNIPSIDEMKLCERNKWPWKGWLAMAGPFYPMQYHYPWSERKPQGKIESLAALHHYKP